MVRRLGGHLLRWGLLALAALIVVAFVGRVIFTLEAQNRAYRTALAVAKSQIADRDASLANQHVTVTVPPPSVTVTVAPGTTQTSTSPAPPRVITVPSPFAVPGATPTVMVQPPKPSTVTVQECPVIHLLVLCL